MLGLSSGGAPKALLSLVSAAATQRTRDIIAWRLPRQGVITLCVGSFSLLLAVQRKSSWMAAMEVKFEGR